jgi:hypothetical protein
VSTPPSSGLAPATRLTTSRRPLIHLDRRRQPSDQSWSGLGGSARRLTRGHHPRRVQTAAPHRGRRLVRRWLPAVRRARRPLPHHPGERLLGGLWTTRQDHSATFPTAKETQNVARAAVGAAADWPPQAGVRSCSPPLHETPGSGRLSDHVGVDSIELGDEVGRSFQAPISGCAEVSCRGDVPGPRQWAPR